MLWGEIEMFKNCPSNQRYVRRAASTQGASGFLCDVADPEAA